MNMEHWEECAPRQYETTAVIRSQHKQELLREKEEKAEQKRKIKAHKDSLKERREAKQRFKEELARTPALPPKQGANSPSS